MFTVTRTFTVEATTQLTAEVMVDKELKAHGIVERHVETLADGTEQEVWGYNEVLQANKKDV